MKQQQTATSSTFVNQVTSVPALGHLRGELGGSCEAVDGEGVAQVVCQVLKRSLACHNGLDEEAEHGEHSLKHSHNVKGCLCC